MGTLRGLTLSGGAGSLGPEFVSFTPMVCHFSQTGGRQACPGEGEQEGAWRLPLGHLSSEEGESLSRYCRPNALQTRWETLRAV